MNVEETSRFGSKKGRKLTSLTNIQKKELCKYKRNNPTKSYEEIGRKTNASVISGKTFSVKFKESEYRFSETAYLRNFL